jgi:hypothetical protein
VSSEKHLPTDSDLIVPTTKKLPIPAITRSTAKKKSNNSTKEETKTFLNTHSSKLGEKNNSNNSNNLNNNYNSNSIPNSKHSSASVVDITSPKQSTRKINFTSQSQSNSNKK